MIRYAQKPEKEGKEQRTTYWSKEALTCPVCEKEFKREELFSGRVNAGDLTDELHRTYIPLHNFGEVFPLIYELTLCPHCLYTAYRHDFANLAEKNLAELRETTEDRQKKVKALFAPLDFEGNRGLLEGAASYYLALLCYEGASREFAPTIKQGLAALRCAWLCAYLDKKNPGENYLYLAQILKVKARNNYRAAVEYEQKGREIASQVRWLGPDTDKNYGFEGVLFLAAILDLKYGPRDNEQKRFERLEGYKRTIAKMFGLGKKSKTKPGPLIDKVRDLYEQLKKELNITEDEE